MRVVGDFGPFANEFDDEDEHIMIMRGTNR